MNLDNIEVRIDKPYPELINVIDDKQTVCILKNLATSRMSELSAVLQYTYQAVISDRANQDIAKVLEEISIVEMMHLEMLMHAITEFGGNPKYEDCQGVPFNVSQINYSIKLKDILESNIRAEQFAIDEYKAAINKVNNESLKSLFRRIIQDEELHIKVFKYVKNNVEFLSI